MFIFSSNSRRDSIVKKLIKLNGYYQTSQRASRLEAYADVLMDYSDNEIDDIISNACIECKWFPSIKELLELGRKYKKNSRVLPKNQKHCFHCDNTGRIEKKEWIEDLGYSAGVYYSCICEIGDYFYGLNYPRYKWLEKESF